MEYKLTIPGVAELTEEIQSITFESQIDASSVARSSNIGVTLMVAGQVACDSGKTDMMENMAAIANWSVLKPRSGDGNYKEVEATFTHDGVERSYKLSHAFAISFKEWFVDQNGHFELVLREKADCVNPENVVVG
jgi:hypothetical protein